MEKINISLFGASGFVGSHLLRVLDGVQPVDIRKDTLTDVKSDVWINCIGKAHDHKGTATPEEYREANVYAVHRIADHFLRSEARLLIHFSSIAAVEEFYRDGILTETDAQRPTSIYGITKKESEDYLVGLQLPPEKKIIILRPSMIHGPGAKGNLRQLFHMVSKGIPYPFGAFQNRRSFLGIDNLGFMVKKIIQQQAEIPSGIYHMADDEAVSVVGLIHMIASESGRKARIIHLPSPLVLALGKMGDVLTLPVNSKKIKKLTSDLVVSNQKIKTALGIERLPLSAEEGLAKTIASFQKTAAE